MKVSTTPQNRRRLVRDGEHMSSIVACVARVDAAGLDAGSEQPILPSLAAGGVDAADSALPNLAPHGPRNRISAPARSGVAPIAGVPSAVGSTLPSRPPTHAALHLAPQSEESLLEQPPETGFLPNEADVRSLAAAAAAASSSCSNTAASSRGKQDGGRGGSSSAVAAAATSSFAYPPAERSQIRESWGTLMRWSRVFRQRREQLSPLQATRKVVVFGGGSFGTAMGAALALQKPDLEVYMLLRDPLLARDINSLHCNTRYLKVWAGCG